MRKSEIQRERPVPLYMRIVVRRLVSTSIQQVEVLVITNTAAYMNTNTRINTNAFIQICTNTSTTMLTDTNTTENISIIIQIKN